MNAYLVGHASELQHHNVKAMFRLRHAVFKERLRWDVTSHEGMESDDYDNLDPVYMVFPNGSQVDGCWRLLPTTGPYMLKDVFPELLCGEPAPRDPQIWEISRFAAAPKLKQDRRDTYLNSATVQMVRRIYDFGVENNIKSYVTVTSVAMERLLTRLGLPMQRLGDGKARMIGKVLTVACQLEVNEQFRRAVYENNAAGHPILEREAA